MRNPLSIKELFEEIRSLLASSGVGDGAHEARVILSSVLGRDRAYLFAYGDERVPEQAMEKIRGCAAARAAGRPLQYALGTAAFMDFELAVDERVLIPRPETEELAEAAAGWLESRAPRADADTGKELGNSGLGMSGAATGSCAEAAADKKLRILDLCTGSGAIAIYLARIFPGALVQASDISAPALELASSNAAALGADVEFMLSDLFENVGGKFDLIISNPPYISKDLIEDLDSVVKDMEPRLALDGGAGGFGVISRILAEAPAHLAPGGALFMEIGHDQGPAARAAALASGLSDVKIMKDLESRDRILFAARPDWHLSLNSM